MSSELDINRAPGGLMDGPRGDDARRRAESLAHLNAFISMTTEDGDGPVVAVKDLIDVRGTATTAGATILRSVAAEDAAVVRNLRKCGCVVIGKTNLHPWAFGATSENPTFGDVLNPHDSRRVAGGSSGGSAVAVATGMCAWAIGTDTGGSIRIPAGLCGVVGFKPTFGALSTKGVVPLAPSLDTVGPLAPSVAAASRAFEIMAGDPLPTGDVPDVRELALAVPANWVEGLDRPTLAAWTAVASELPQIELPERAAGGRAALTVLYTEAAAVHREWIKRHADEYPPAVLEKLEHGRGITETEYMEALVACRQFRADVEEAMAGWDALLVPATACIAPFVGRAADATEPLTRFTRPFNATGQPVVVLPVPGCPLPVGAQIVGHFGDDAALLRTAAAVERAWSPAVPGRQGRASE